MMFLLPLLSLFSLALTTPTTSKTTYEYIVVGSGAGGGPLAANLARAGHSVLLLEAGSDQTANTNVSITANAVLADSDPKMRWDFFVRHTDDVNRDNQYTHTVWRQTDDQLYVGLAPPPGAVRLGVWCPRVWSPTCCPLACRGCSRTIRVIAIPPPCFCTFERAEAEKPGL